MKDDVRQVAIEAATNVEYLNWDEPDFGEIVDTVVEIVVGRCSTCMHWGRRIGSAGICAAIPHKWDEPDDNEPPLIGMAATSCSFSDSGSWLLTAPNFGCVLHEPVELGAQSA